MKKIHIGTRSSKLALWQAKKVQQLIREHSGEAQIVPVESHGDIDLKTPIYELGIQGVFTKTLDIALLNKQVDIAVHSYKDVPTKLAEGLTIAAVLKRDNPSDMLLVKKDAASIKRIATSSIRRKAQWLNRYPDHEVFNVRGNVQTRLEKFAQEKWDAIIFAAAGLERLNCVPENASLIDWMLPAPAQGVVVVICREEDTGIQQLCAAFHDTDTAVCTGVERDFLSQLYGGCSAPIGAYATINNDQVYFRGNLLSTDGKIRFDIAEYYPLAHAAQIGHHAAQQILQQGGDKIIHELRSR
jgi:hydroxymethylbilane synthase